MAFFKCYFHTKINNQLTPFRRSDRLSVTWTVSGANFYGPHFDEISTWKEAISHFTIRRMSRVSVKEPHLNIKPYCMTTAEKKVASLETLCINTVRVLAADAVQAANSGHPGTPMALAPLGHVLWSKIMHYSPQNPQWPGRDRFILSAGHACILQYSYLYLTGYDLTLNDLKKFRQLHSKTPGHPEYGLTAGIEATTGPLGQGFANGVGMGIAQQWLADRFNKPGFDLFNYRIYVICSDGDMMEGISSEAASIAGNLQLGYLVYIYDDNRITIEGNTDITFTEDLAARFVSYGWHVQVLPDGNDLDAMEEALEKARQETSKPSLIKLRTHIGYGSPHKVDTAAAHGSPLGAEEVGLVKQFFGFDPGQSFVIPENVLSFYRNAGKKGIDQEKQWNNLFNKYREQYPVEANEYVSAANGKIPAGWKEKLPVFDGNQKMATRKASGKVLNAIATHIPFLMGGSADLSPSTDTILDGRMTLPTPRNSVGWCSKLTPRTAPAR